MAQCKAVVTPACYGVTAVLHEAFDKKPKVPGGKIDRKQHHFDTKYFLSYRNTLYRFHYRQIQPILPVQCATDHI